MLELYLRSIPDINIPLDGFKFLKVVRETDSEMQVIALSYLLPYEEVPMELTLKQSAEVTEYFLRYGKSDNQWKSQTEAKRWKSVYLYATSNIEPSWNWQKETTGKLDS